MKRLLSISLAVLLALSLGITMFQPQSVEASPSGGEVFSITAKGQGDYKITNPVEEGTGEFSVRVTGQVSEKGSSMGWANPPDAVAGGHIRGSFGDHIIQASLHGKQVHFNCQHGIEPERLIHITSLTVRGTFDGEKIETPSNKHVSVYYEDSIKIIRVYLHNFPSPNTGLIIKLYETGDKAADVFEVKIREVGK